MQRVASIRKNGAGIGIMGGMGTLGAVAAQLGGGINSRTTSRGGGTNIINNPSPQNTYSNHHQFYNRGSEPSTAPTENAQDSAVHYKKLKVNSEV